MKTDTLALSNAACRGGGNNPPDVGLASSVLPEKVTRIGVSSNYVPKEGHQWFVFVPLTIELKQHTIMACLKKRHEISYLRYYRNKTKDLSLQDGKHPPLTIGYDEMMNYIRVTSIDDEHVKVVDMQQCHYKSGDMVRIIDGKFKGVMGRVARVSGQQRVVVEVEGLCLVATAYVPSAFIERMNRCD